ncbi:MAG: hypothetical protein K8R92_11850 [Planctomycetes bacterium]|nr:hypothetical protein [Planctomycetota bacterium]
MSDRSPRELEHLIHRHLSELPSRRAPRTLESRVMAAIEQRAALPWHRKSFSEWPEGIRMTFLAFAATVGVVVVTAFYILSNGIRTSDFLEQSEDRLGLFAKAFNACTWVFDFTNDMLATIPPLWHYGSIALIAALYASFFGLCAFTYRTFIRNHGTPLFNEI